MLLFSEIRHLITICALLWSRLLSTQQHHLMMLVLVEVSWTLLRLMEGMVLWETTAGSTAALILMMWVYYSIGCVHAVLYKDKYTVISICLHIQIENPSRCQKSNNRLMWLVLLVHYLLQYGYGASASGSSRPSRLDWRYRPYWCR